MEILSPDEVKAVLAAMRDTTVFPQVAVLLSTGARRGELMGLKWSDLDLDAGKVDNKQPRLGSISPCSPSSPTPWAR